MAINKVVYGTNVLVDLTEDTVSADKMLSGVTAHDKAGTVITGSIATKTSSDLTASGSTVTVPAGYYSSQATKQVATMTLPTTLSSTTFGTLVMDINPSETTSYLSIPPGYLTNRGYYTIVGVSPTYVGSGITRRDSTDLTASGATVSVPAGYYAEAATKSVTTMTLPTSAAASATSGYTSKATISRSTSDQYINIPPGYNSVGGYYKISAVANGSATAPASISGTSATVSTGTNTLTLTKTVSVTPSVSAGYISSGTAGNSSVSLTASVTTKAAATITPTTTNQTIAAGTYLTGIQTIAGDADLIASNIKSGVNIFGVAGSYSGIDTSDATAAATDIINGKTAYVDGRKVEGSLVVQKYYTGSSAPSSSLGNNGDIYFQS